MRNGGDYWDFHDGFFDFHTSDTHFGHENIIGYSGRPWDNAAEMNEGLVERWNSMVKPGDKVVHHGDFSMNMTNIEFVKRLNGLIYLLAGNHDKCWSFHKKGADKAREAYLEAGFAGIIKDGILTDYRLPGGRLVTLSHLPYAGDHGPHDRYQAERPIDNGQVNICGHVHEKWLVQDRSINVGVDVWDWYPVPSEELAALVNERF